MGGRQRGDGGFCGFERNAPSPPVATLQPVGFAASLPLAGLPAAQQILDGRKDIPHDLLVPYLAFTQDNFEAALPTIEKGSFASAEYPQDDAKKAIDANMKK